MTREGPHRRDGDRVTPLRARHTTATLLLLQGVPPRVAMQILGHSQIGLTLGTYTHVVPELAREAAARLGAALWDPPAAPPAAPLQPRLHHAECDEGSPDRVSAGQMRWGRRDSNPRPRDYESPALTR
jgi:hypothetical protein